MIDEAIESNDTCDFSSGSSGSGAIAPIGILLDAHRIRNASRKVTWDPAFASMGSHSQAGEESNFVVGGGGGSDPSVSNIQEEASTDKLGGEESDITSTQIVVTSTAAEVEVSCSIVFFILIFFSFSVGRNAHMYIDLLNRFIFFLTFYTKPVNQHSSWPSF